MKERTCCFIGRRKIEDTLELRRELYDSIERLITEEKVDTFLFGSKSRFNDLCHELVTKIKEKYPHIKRTYVRAEYLDIDESYKSYLLESYEDTYYPEKIIDSGRAAYVERNYEMINKSRFCIFYYDEQNAPTTRKSGTKIALDYAIKQGKQIINMCQFNKELIEPEKKTKKKVGVTEQTDGGARISAIALHIIIIYKQSLRYFGIPI